MSLHSLKQYSSLCCTLFECIAECLKQPFIPLIIMKDEGGCDLFDTGKTSCSIVDFSGGEPNES